MMLEKRRLHLIYIFLGLVVTLSIWQAIIGPDSPYITYQETIVLASPLKSNNFSYIYPINVLPRDDYSKLMDLENFSFQVVEIVCNDSDILLLILVHTAPSNFDKRRVIRETWGQKREGMRIVFMLGDVQNSTLIEKLEEENETNRDFAQGNFFDTYRNMTYKHIMVFKYVIYHCPQAKYILKTDDDVFVNTVMLISFLKEELSPFGATNLLFCHLHKHAPVLRSFRSKWRVSAKEFPDRRYPPYCSGYVIIYSPDVVFSLYKSAQKSKYFWIDDVLITGVLAQKNNITHSDVTPFILDYNSRKRIMRGLNISSINFLFGSADLKEEEIRCLWNFVRRRISKNN